MIETSCWNCNAPYDKAAEACPNCSAANANVNEPLAMRQMMTGELKKKLSPSAEVAQELANKVNQLKLNNPFGGDVVEGKDSKERKIRIVHFSRSAIFDGTIHIYNPTFIRVFTRGKKQVNEVCRSLDEALKLLHTM